LGPEKIEATSRKAANKSGADKSQRHCHGRADPRHHGIYVTMVYGRCGVPGGVVPDQDRYTSMSLPYHSVTVVRRHAAAHGDGDGCGDRRYYYGLWYPIVVAIMTLIIARCS